MAQQQLGVRSGYATADTCKITACSLVSGTVTISINGSTFPITMVQIGTDNTPTQNQAGYVGSTTITGLSGFTKYNYTATQGVNVISGSLYTAPSSNDDFCFYFASCDNNTSTTTEVGALESLGAYDHIKNYIESNQLPCVGILHVDDHGYWDWNKLDDSLGTTHAVSGAPSQAYTTALEYDYALGALANFGLFSDSGNAYCTFGHDDIRIWAMRNINVWPQWGDHDAGNDEMGWNKNPSDVTGSPSPNTQYTNSKAVWDAFMLPLQPPAIDGVNSNAWGMELGCAYICAPDAITNGSGDATDTFPVGFSGPTTLYGNTQIDSCLTALDNDSEFKILGLTHSIRYLNATASKNGSGAQNPLFDNNLAEYQRLFTATGNTPASLMENNKTNGVFGTLFCLHGDYHVGQIVKHEAAAYGGNAKEWFYSITPGTINGSINHTNTQGVAVDDTYNGSTVELMQVGVHDYWACRVEVYGSRFNKEIHVIMINQDGTEVFKKKFVHGRGGNDAHEISKDLSLKTSIASDI